MNSKSTKAKRSRIPTYTIAELEDAGKLPPFTYLTDPLERMALEEERKEVAKSARQSNGLL